MEQQLYELPEEWAVAKLCELCEFKNGLWKGKKPPYIHVGVIRNTNFRADGALDDTDIAILDVEKKQFTKRQLQYGDLILEKSGGGPNKPVGRVILFDKKDGLYSFSNFTSIIRIVEPSVLDFNYLHKLLYWYHLSGVTEAMQRRTTGIRNLDFNAYKELLIPLPPLNEQKRIVAKLDALFTRIDTAITHLQQTVELSKALFASALDEAFNADGHSGISIDDVAMLVSGQHLKKGEYTEVEIPGSIPYLTGPAEFGDISPEPSRWTKTRRSIAISGDSLITVKGSGVGKVNMMFAPEIAISRQLMAVRSKGQLDKSYLHLFFLARQQVFADKKIGAAIPGIGRRDVLEQVIPTPSLKEQKQIITHLDALAKHTRALEAATKEKLKNLTALKASLLDAAFKGQL